MIMSDFHLDRMPKNCYDIPHPPLEVNGLNNSVSIVDDSLYDTVCPINPLTGHRDDLISRLFSGDTSDSERQLIMSQLASVKGVSSPAGLSDEDIISLIPPRYMSDPVELERYREVVDSLRKSVEDLDPTDSAPTDSAPTDPASASTPLAG